MDFVRRQIEVEAVEGVSIHPNCNAKKSAGKIPRVPSSDQARLHPDVRS
jgi:hypothetical protein